MRHLRASDQPQDQLLPRIPASGFEPGDTGIDRRNNN